MHVVIITPPPHTHTHIHTHTHTYTHTHSISGPIPGITPKFDNSVDGKFTVHGQDGRVINLRPKVIREEDVATPPIKGQTVQVVPREKILVSQGG